MKHSQFQVRGPNSYMTRHTFMFQAKCQKLNYASRSLGHARASDAVKEIKNMSQNILKSNEDMILALAGQLSHEPEKFT